MRLDIGSWVIAMNALSLRNEAEYQVKVTAVATDHTELNAVIKTLKDGQTAEPTTIRNFLSWFDVQRRTVHNVAYIDTQLEKGGVRTVPNYLDRWVDSPITFELLSEHNLKSDSTPLTRKPTIAEAVDIEISLSADPIAGDPSASIGNIPSARQPLVRIKPTANLQEAITLMVARNFSQLPVMTNERDVRGVISWASIGARSTANVDEATVQHYMDKHQEIDISASLFAGIKIIADHDYVLVRDVDRIITGIVTASDIALQFEKLSAPFILLSEIENRIRILIIKRLSNTDVKKACKDEFLPKNYSSVHQLTFGNCIRVLEYPENWEKLKLKMDRKIFCNELENINEIRNNVMHFNPDSITAENVSRLKDSSRMFEILQNIGAF
jgi:CBS domain-containing protein